MLKIITKTKKKVGVVFINLVLKKFKIKKSNNYQIELK